MCQNSTKNPYLVFLFFITKVNNSVTVTASGRIVKKRFKLLDDDPEQEVNSVLDSWQSFDPEKGSQRNDPHWLGKVRTCLQNVCVCMPSFLN